MSGRLLRALFVAYVAATVLHVGWIMLHEPFSFDAWNIADDTRGESFTVGRFFDYWGDQYAHSNPRLGQAFTYLAYKLVWFAPIATPVAFLALAAGAVVLGTGRWPSWRRGRDLAFVGTAIGSMWFALPSLGMIMFCRAYGANYLYGAAVQLWFLVPLRMAKRESLDRTAPPSGGAAGERSLAVVRWIAYGVFGVAAGMSNEHTGPTLCAFLLGHAIWRYLRRGNSWLAWAGALGAAIGFAIIFFAPGQGERYDATAQQVGLLDRLLQRGIVINFDIFRDLVLAAAPLLALLAVALILDDGGPARADARRRALRLVALVFAAATLVTMTLFVSPKLGPRFYLLPMTLLLAGFVGVADATLASARRLAPFVVLAVLASGYAAMRTLPLYARVSAESDARLAALDATKPGDVFTAESFAQYDPSWWFLGEDFRDVKKRDLVARYFGLRGVILRGVDLDAPLGVTDVRLVPHAELEPASCLDDHGGLELGAFQGVDVASIQKAMRAAIEQLRARLPAGARLSRLDLVVAFAGDPPPLFAKTLVVGRWRPDGFDGWAGKIMRPTSDRDKVVIPPKDFPAADYELWIYQVGGEARRLDESRAYTPWKSGAYWALACKRGQTAECFVIAATRQL